jgi:hypothetical protein
VPIFSFWSRILRLLRSGRAFCLQNCRFTGVQYPCADVPREFSRFYLNPEVFAV